MLAEADTMMNAIGASMIAMDALIVQQFVY
jgi:hypothetical protein